MIDGVRRLAGAYFLLQAAAVAGWWGALWAWPSLRAHFQADPASGSSLLAFWLPDLLLLAGGSAAAGIAVLRRHPLAFAASVAVAGACAYATLYCLAASLLTDHGWWSVAAMVPAAFLSVVAAGVLAPGARERMRRAVPRPPRAHLARTGAQIAVFWSVLLFLVPLFLVRLQGELGLPILRFEGQAALGSALFAGLSALGVWSGATMALHGEGTPLPLESARRLVVGGPYAYVRNPMAIAGLGQGMAVALTTGSMVVAAYVAVGTALWQWVARPLEEEDLARWFGAEYGRYRREVRCWIPRHAPFGAAPAFTPRPNP